MLEKVGKDRVANEAVNADTRQIRAHWLEDEIRHGELHRKLETIEIS